ncbi:MAG: M48 family metalloprotease [bacterium]|nr:M48 family metalloprotease [bacterium]MCP5068313.1 M48 family metalloprotease [bacterium]
MATLYCACATNPVTGERQVTFMSTEREVALGRQESAKVASQIGLVEMPRLTDYVSVLGARLANHSPRRDVEYRFAVADMAEPNAFALPGGWIYVSRGLLAITGSEDELAGVVGHEIGHVAARHSATRETRQIGVGLLTLLGVAAAGAAGGASAAESVAQLGQVAGAGLIATYGRDQERQADQVGQEIAARAGYDPAGIADFLATLDRDSVLRAGGKRRSGSFFDSHPVTDERVRDTTARAQRLTPANLSPIARDRNSFYSRLDGLLVGADPSQGVFQGELFLHPTFGFSLRFPAGWRTQNGHSAVVGISAKQDRAITLEGGPVVSDPGDAARAFARQAGVVLEDGKRTKIGGLPAYRAVARAQGRNGTNLLHLTWIAHRKATFLITGISGARASAAELRELGSAAASFRPLSRRQRGSIMEQRLRIVEARAGESLAALEQRTGNSWSVAETAVANGLSESVRLRPGQRVKIVRAKVYVPSSR